MAPQHAPRRDQQAPGEREPEAHRALARDAATRSAAGVTLKWIAPTLEHVPGVAALLTQGTTPDVALAQAERFTRKHGAPDQRCWIGLHGELVVVWTRVKRVEIPDDAPPNAIPAGWYLMGVNVHRQHRRRGLGRLAVEVRHDWLAHIGVQTVHTFLLAGNDASLRLHEQCGYRVTQEDVWCPGIDDPPGIFWLMRWDAPGR